MIDWVMPPQTVVALYIYRAGRFAPQGILLQLEIRKDSTILLGLGVHRSNRSGPPVRPVRPTGQTGVAVAESATRHPTGQTVVGHQYDRWCQPDRVRTIFVHKYQDNKHETKHMQANHRKHVKQVEHDSKSLI
jgi:hypothetical protein